MQIYLSYDQSDVAAGLRLKTTLQPAQQAIGFTIWSIQDVAPGNLIQRDMAAHLRGAKIFVPLVSANFLASDRCNAEMTAAVQLAAMGQLQIVSVLLRPCSWQYSPLRSFPMLPTNGKEVMSYRDRDRAWVEVQQGILRVLQQGRLIE